MERLGHIQSLKAAPPSLKLTQPLKKGHPKRKLIFQPPFFRGYGKLQANVDTDPVFFCQGLFGPALPRWKVTKEDGGWGVDQHVLMDTSTISSRDKPPSNTTEHLKGKFGRWCYSSFSGVLILRQRKEVEQKLNDLFAEGLGNRRVSGVYTSIYLLWLEKMAHNSHLFWSLNSPFLELSKTCKTWPQWSIKLPTFVDLSSLWTGASL